MQCVWVDTTKKRKSRAGFRGLLSAVVLMLVLLKLFVSSVCLVPVCAPKNTVRQKQLDGHTPTYSRIGRAGVNKTAKTSNCITICVSNHPPPPPTPTLSDPEVTSPVIRGSHFMRRNGDGMLCRSSLARTSKKRVLFWSGIRSKALHGVAAPTL